MQVFHELDFFWTKNGGLEQCEMSNIFRHHY